MTKLLNLRITLLTIIILTGAGISQAQDSTKKVTAAKPVAVKPKYSTYNKPVAAAPTTGTAAVPATAIRVQPRPVPVQQPAAPVDKSLRGQYQYLLTKVYNYQQ